MTFPDGLKKFEGPCGDSRGAGPLEADIWTSWAQRQLPGAF